MNGHPTALIVRGTPASGPPTLWERFHTRLAAFHPWCWQAIIFLLSFAIIVSRRPDVILRPQFWAEDGQLFYAQAYNAGWLHPLFWSAGGYLHTVPRLIAAVAQFFPLIYAPLLFSLAAIIVQILPISMLLSGRLSAIGSLPTRVLLSFLYLFLPNSSEIHANVTNIHWHLAVLAALVVLASPPRSTLSGIFDALAVLMGALTGPFAIMLVIPAFLFWRKRREPWKLILTLTFAAGASVQGILLLLAGRSHRMVEALGANFTSLAEILADHIFLGALLGRNALLHGHPVGALLVASLGLAALLYAVTRGPFELKLFTLFAGLVLACSLASPMPWPMIREGEPAARPRGWEALALGLGQRYWYVPMLAFVATLVWLLKSTTPVALRLGAIFCLALMPFGVVRDWRVPPMVDLHFAEYAQKFQQAPSGTVLVIPLNPPGWSMRLVKH